MIVIVNRSADAAVDHVTNLQISTVNIIIKLVFSIFKFGAEFYCDSLHTVDLERETPSLERHNVKLAGYMS